MGTTETNTATLLELDMARYIVAETTNAVYNRWEGLAHRHGPLTEQQMRLIGLVQKHLDAGVFYNSDMNAKVIADLGDDLTPEDFLIGKGKVEGGCIGYEIYHAQKYCEAVKFRIAQEEARDHLQLKVGQKLGALIFGFDHKLNSACVVIEVTDGGKMAKLQAKRIVPLSNRQWRESRKRKHSRRSRKPAHPPDSKRSKKVLTAG
jgi:hypothetical protein